MLVLAVSFDAVPVVEVPALELIEPCVDVAALSAVLPAMVPAVPPMPEAEAPVLPPVAESPHFAAM
jgi:hypothetical protein